MPPAAGWSAAGRAAGGTLIDSRLLWFVNRGTGVVLLALLTGTVVLGVLATVRTNSRYWPRFVTQALHRNVALLALALVLVHSGAAIVDSYVDLRWTDLVLPFVAGYRPFWTGFGTLAFDLLLAATLSSLIRSRLGHRGWWLVHLSTYACWLAALVHGLGIGTDQRQVWAVSVTALSIGLVTGVGVFRIGTLVRERRMAT